MLIRIAGFDWDAGNKRKCLKHGLLPSIIEEFFRGQIRVSFDSKHSETEPRFIAIGNSAQGRPMFVGFTYRKYEDEFYIRPITARYMHAKELTRYEKEEDPSF